MSFPPPSVRVSSQQTYPLNTGWRLAAAPAGAYAQPQQALYDAALLWQAAVVPGTVAQSLHADVATALAMSSDYDACDWWYHCTFTAPQEDAGTRYRLRCDGLATLAEVWLNSTPLLSTHNMFVPHLADIDDLQAENELVLCFRSLGAALAARRPRPRWKTGLVQHQQLRWFRTTLLGRIPGWTPPVAPVGPWRDIKLEKIGSLDIAALDIQCSARAGAGTQCGTGTLKLSGQLQCREAVAPVSQATLYVGDREFSLTVDRAGAATMVTGDVEIPDVPLWSPHTHGAPVRLPCHLEVRLGSAVVRIDCGQIGFKEIGLDRSHGQVQFVVNGVPVFCRGACWTINDIVSLTGSREQLRQALAMARDAGLNMLRVGGTMIYEADEFYELCDEFGILVWQDFMFANMDYPVADASFRAAIDHEVQMQLNRLQRHPCIAAYCGNSEVQQQAAMLGLPAAEWSNEFFDSDLARYCAELHPGIPYFSSTPCEGALPFHVGAGLSHYYGVGAYRRPLTDVRHAGVKFTPECLGFSNVPEPETCELIMEGTAPPPHHPAWKARVPRDSGAGWDFEDIRDYYLQLLFGFDPVALRSQDLDRYLALSRAVSGEVMHRVFAAWRQPHSGCGGALVWFYKDLWPGAGWGILDSQNRPKAAYYYLKRAWASPAIFITDEGLDGLHLHVINESEQALDATVEIQLLQTGRMPLATAAEPLQLSARASATIVADRLLGRFTDLTYSYRFGPPQHDVVVARLQCATTGVTLSEAYYFPHKLNLPMLEAAPLAAVAALQADGRVEVQLESAAFLQMVHIAARGYLAHDNDFHLAPGRLKTVWLSPQGAAPRKFKATVRALNLRDALSLRATGPD